MIREAGFTEAEQVSETGFNSSPVTKGVLFRARRPTASKTGRVEVSSQESALASMAERKTGEPAPQKEKAASAAQESCFT